MRICETLIHYHHHKEKPLLLPPIPLLANFQRWGWGKVEFGVLVAMLYLFLFFPDAQQEIRNRGCG